MWRCLTLSWYILTLSGLVDFLPVYLLFSSLFWQVERMRNLEDKDDEYKIKLNEKLQMADYSGLIQVYS